MHLSMTPRSALVLALLSSSCAAGVDDDPPGSVVLVASQIDLSVDYSSGVLLSRPVGGEILGAMRPGGDMLRYNVRTNEFAVGAADGTIRTLFRPQEGIEYWFGQLGAP
jgi:hypothetical protein